MIGEGIARCLVARDWTVAVTGFVLALVILIVLKRFEHRVTSDIEQH